MIDYNATRMDLNGLCRYRILSETNPGSTFIPNSPQFDLIRAIGRHAETGKVIYLMTSANGTGKTTTWINIIGNIAFPGLSLYRYAKDLETGDEYNGFFDFPLYRQWPDKWPKLFWVVAHAKNMAGINRRIQTWWPEGRYSPYKAGYEYYSRYETDTGFTIQCMTPDMDWKAFESDDVGFVAFDEPPKKWQYDASILRTRMGGLILIAATAVFEAGWFLDSVVDEAKVKGSTKYHQTVHVDTNCIQSAGEWDLREFGVQKKGNLEKFRVDILKAECPPELYPARIEGKLMILSGIVIKTYDRELHFNEPTIWPYERGWYMYRMVVDDHLRRPPFICWIRFDRWGKRKVIREWPSIKDSHYHGRWYHEVTDRHPYDVAKICEICIDIEDELQIPPNRMQRLFDPNFAKQPHPKKTGMTMVQHWSEESAKIYKRKNVDRPHGKRYRQNERFVFGTEVDNELEGGFQALRNLMTPTMDGHLLWSLDPEWCHNIDLALRRFDYKEMPHDRREADGLWEKINQKYKDMIDVIRYDAMVPFRWLPPEGIRTVDGREDYRPTRRLGGRIDSRGRAVPTKPEGVA